MCMSVVNLVFANKMTLPLMSHGLSPPESTQIRINSAEKFDNQIQVGVLIKSREGRSIFGTILTVRAIFLSQKKFTTRRSCMPNDVGWEFRMGVDFDFFFRGMLGDRFLQRDLLLGVFHCLHRMSRQRFSLFFFS